MHTIRSGWWLLFVVVASPLVAAPAERTTEPAYSALPVNRPAARAVFRKRLPRPGDRVAQAVRVAVDLESTIREQDQVVDTSRSKFTKTERRTVETVRVEDGRAVEATVSFEESSRAMEGQPATEYPHVGLAYRATRTPQDELKVERADGSLPSAEEFQHVQGSMESLGRSNPLADWLAGQQFTVGQKVEVPAEIGGQIIGGSGEMGVVERFELTLRELAESQGRPVAVFDASLQAGGGGNSQISLTLAGTIQVELDTCRVPLVELSGPLLKASKFGSYTLARETYVKGKLDLRVAADFASN